MIKKYTKGFTLIELLIAVAILGIIAAVAFVALNPGRRLEDSRNARRWADISAIAGAIKVNQVDGGGAYTTNLGLIAAATPTMIGTCASTSNCPVLAAECQVAIPGLTSGINLSTDAGATAALNMSNYLASNPVAPDGTDSAVVWDSVRTGYYITKSAAGNAGTVTITSCESEPAGTTAIIQVQR